MSTDQYPSLFANRIDVQDRVRRLRKEPSIKDTKEVEHLRQLLATQFSVFDDLRLQATDGVFEVHRLTDNEDPAQFDDLDEADTGPTATANSVAEDNASVPNGAALPEHRTVAIPSRWISQGNIYQAIECDLHVTQADKCLQMLRDLIADKSFQYSHVIRVAPRQAVRTWARALIAQLNHKISYFSRVYGQCRLAMMRLGMDNATLSRYGILEKQDLKSSTALLNPNEPGGQHGCSYHGSGRPDHTDNLHNPTHFMNVSLNIAR